MTFTANGQRIAVVDDAVQLTLLTIGGEVVWQRSLNYYNFALAGARNRVYAPVGMNDSALNGRIVS